jgi:TRAP-type C4-dicarboxylate transport system substrate-binding protein
MSVRTVSAVVVVLALLAAVAYFLSVAGAGAQSPEARSVSWLLSHQPTAVFERAAAVFKDELEKETGGALTLVVRTPQDIGIEAGDVPNSRVLEALRSGEADIATAYTVALGYESPDMWAVNLPFLFANSDSVSDVLDGEAGAAIFDSLDRRGDIVGLAFTMSGGYRIIA